MHVRMHQRVHIHCRQQSPLASPKRVTAKAPSPSAAHLHSHTAMLAEPSCAGHKTGREYLKFLDSQKQQQAVDAARSELAAAQMTGALQAKELETLRRVLDMR